jgi:DNA-directed RNA polymerase-5 subunit 1
MICQALNILKKIPDDTKKKLAARGYIAQPGYVMKYLPVPPNCLYIPEFTDGQSIMSYVSFSSVHLLNLHDKN